MFIFPTPKDSWQAVITVLSDAFGAYASVSAEMPRRRPERFVQVTIVGGSQPNLVTDKPRVLVECFGRDKKTAYAMCRTAATALRNAGGTTVDGVFIRGWDNQQGPTDFPHPDILDMARMQFHGELNCSTN